MRRVVLIFVSMLVACSINAQEHVRDTLLFEKYKNVFDEEKSGLWDICEILDLEVLDYYGLSKKYKTELQRKMFLESDEGKKLVDKLKEKKNELLNTNSLVVFRFSRRNARYGDIEMTYDLDSKMFRADAGVVSMDPNYINYDGLLLKREGKAKAIKNIVVERSEYIAFPMTEEIALSLENVVRNDSYTTPVDIVWELRINDIKHLPSTGDPFLDAALLPSNIIGTIVNIYIVDAYTHEVYYAFDEERWEQEVKRRQLIRDEKIRLEEERKKKEQEEAVRKEKERREKINSFLEHRQTKVYEMPSSNRRLIDGKLYDILSNMKYITDSYGLLISVKDVISVNFKGETSHLLEVEIESGSDENYYDIKKSIEKEITAIDFPRAKMLIPGADTLCSISSRYVYKSIVEVQRCEATVKMNNKGEISFKKGDPECCVKNIEEIRNALYSRYRKGVFDVVVYRKMIDDIYAGADVVVLNK